MPQAIPQEIANTGRTFPQAQHGSMNNPQTKKPPALEPGAKKSPVKYHPFGAHAKPHERGSFPSPRYARTQDRIQ